jgi:low temperature requirement protein LtrA
MRSIFLHRPVLQTGDSEGMGRKTSWLELFYDLIFVVVIAELSQNLATDISMKGVLGFSMMFLPVWWVWVSGVSYAERFEAEDVGHRIVMFLQMLPIACLAFFARRSLEAGSAGFALSYVGAKCLLTVLWSSAAYHNAVFRPVAKRIVYIFAAGSVCFLVSVLVPAPARFMLWGLGLLIDLSLPWWTVKLRKLLPPVNLAKYSERLGLFTIIVLGQTIVAVISGVSQAQAVNAGTVIVGLLGMALTFCIWWLYFDRVASREPKSVPGWATAWISMHGPLVMGLAMISAGIQHVTAGSVGVSVSRNVETLMIGSTALVLAAIGLLELTLRVDDVRRVGAIAKIITAGALPLLALADVWLGPGLILAILLGVFFLHICFSSSGKRVK